MNLRTITPICGAALLALACSGNGPAATKPLASGDITTWAGDGTQGNDGDQHALVDSWLNQPMALRFDGDSTAWIADWNSHCVREVTAKGTLETVIGEALPGDWPCQNPEDPASCEVGLGGEISGRELRLNHPIGIEPDPAGGFYLAAWHNHKLLHYDAHAGEVTIVAGAQRPGFAGDGGPASSALLNFPAAVAIQTDGGLLVADERNNRVRRIEPDGDRLIATVVGVAPMMGMDADGLPATSTRLMLTTTDEAAGSDNPPPGGNILLEEDGALLIADTFHHCVRRVAPGEDGLVGVGDPAEERVSTLAGTCGASGYDGDGGAAEAARVNRPFGLARGPDRALYIADTFNHVVRRVDPESGEITTVAGTGEPGFSGDGGPATAARLRQPYNITFDRDGNLYVVDTQNNRIRQIAR